MTEERSPGTSRFGLDKLQILGHDKTKIFLESFYGWRRKREATRRKKEREAGMAANDKSDFKSANFLQFPKKHSELVTSHKSVEREYQSLKDGIQNIQNIPLRQ